MREFTVRARVTTLVLAPAVGLAVWNLVTRTAATWPFDVHLRDDAYYYFAWARSLAAGSGPCVTEGVWTSGVHPLWGLILAGVALVTDALPVVSVALGLLLHLLTGAVLYAVAAPDRRLGGLAAAVYLGSPFLAVEAMNGQETGLACLALALLCRGHRRGLGTFFGLGLLVVAARSDLWFFVLVLALVEPGQRLRRLGVVAAISLCYALGNFILGGSWLQHSAAPMPWLMAETYARDPARQQEALVSLWTSVVVGHPFRLSSSPMALAWLLTAVLGLRRREPQFAWLLAGGLALVVVHCFWRLYPRDYYFAPLGVVGVLAAIRFRAWYPRLGLLLFVVALVWNGRHLLDPAPAYNGQREMTMAGRFVQRLVPPGEPIGCFNSGIVTWEHPGRVVNLDGVVNADAFAALRRHGLARYLAAQGVHYVVDNPVQFEADGLHANGRYFGADFRAAVDLREIVRFVWPDDPHRARRRAGTDWFSLYRVRDGGAAPPRLPPGAEDLGPAPGGRYVRWTARPGQRLLVGAVRDGARPLVTAAADLVYVIYVPWDGHRGLRLWLRDVTTPILAIAPG